jgi:Collagen triple helix repeat (20 copies)
MKKSITVLAALTLVLAVSSGAFAARGLLTGAAIQDGSLTGADIKKKSLGAGVFTPSTRNSLRGLTGPRGVRGSVGLAGSTGLTGSDGAIGANGLQGVQGVQGIQGIAGASGTGGTNGADGTVAPLSATAAGPTALPTASPPTTVVSLSVPAGNYVVLAKTQLSHTGAGDSIDCQLKAGVVNLDQISMKTHPALAAVPVSLQAVTTIASTTQLSVECDVLTANGSAAFSSLIAIPTA